MSTSDHSPRDALFIRWGKFEAGAFGRPAVIGLSLISLVILLSWLGGFW